MKRIFMIGYSTDKGGVEAYIKNISSQLEGKYEIILHWPTMNIDGKEWVVPANRHNYVKYQLFWRKFFHENKFDVIYYNTCDIVSIDLLKFAKGADIPVRIIHSHNTGNQVVAGGLLGWFHKWQERNSRKNLHKYATDLLACSKTAGDWMFDGRPYIIIKNGIDISRYVYSRTARQNVLGLLKNTAGKVVACLGRLDRQKNPFMSLSIFTALCQKNRDFQCLFIGDGEYRIELEAKVQALGLQHRIIFTGGVNNVNEWLSYIDCLLMPSFFEGLPFALVEAQAAGIHCLVSDTVSQEANITGLVEYKSLNASVEEWADRLLELAAMPRVDMSDSLISAGYSITNAAAAIEKIINQGLKVCK